MSQGAFPEVFTAAEVAHAAGVPAHAVDSLIAEGELQAVPGTRFFSLEDAVRAGRVLRARAAEHAEGIAATPAAIFSMTPGTSLFAHRRSGLQAGASSFIHAALLVTIGLFAAGSAGTASEAVVTDPPRMVFMISPGPGGGGGGGGMRMPTLASRIERTGPRRARVSVPKTRIERVVPTTRAEEPPRPTPPPPPQPKPAEKPPEPLPSRVLVAPVVTTASNDRDLKGVIEKPAPTPESAGTGADGGAGSGRGTGNGEGLGSGLGDGSGGGTGGGPYRPGSGIDPPRLLHEVKAEYTEEARRRGITGDVVLEIVIRRDGSVGEVTIQRGLGGGLDQRAASAVRQWRFSPARRKGEPVDVIVEVAVEFTLR